MNELLYYSDVPITAPYFQYSQPTTEFDAVSGDLNHSMAFYDCCAGYL